jgi:hypothetical protein
MFMIKDTNTNATATPYMTFWNGNEANDGSNTGLEGRVGLVNGGATNERFDFWCYRTGTPVSFATQGTERLRITSAGKIGINSTSPTYALEVDGGTQNTVIVARSSDAKAAISFLDNTTGGYGRATIGAEGTEVYITSGTSGAERLRITSEGYLFVRDNGTQQTNTTLSYQSEGAFFNSLYCKNNSRW